MRARFFFELLILRRALGFLRLRDERRELALLIVKQLFQALGSGETELAERLDALGPIPSYDDFERWIAWVGFVQTEIVRRGYSWRNFQGPGADWNDRILAAMAVSPSLAEPPPEPDPPFTNGPATPHREITVSADDWMIYERVGVRFEVPFVMIMGAYDWQTPITLARDYYAAVSAYQHRINASSSSPIRRTPYFRRSRDG